MRVSEPTMSTTAAQIEDVGLEQEKLNPSQVVQQEETESETMQEHVADASSTAPVELQDDAKLDIQASQPDQTVHASAANGDQQVTDSSAQADKSKTENGDTANEGEEFPAIGSDQLNDFFYYVVRVTVPKKIHTKVIWQLAQKLAKQAGLQMYQLMLGHDPEIGVWENPRPDKNYRHLVWAVPLCNRNTHISGSIIASVVTVFQDTMRKVGGIADFSSQNDIQKRLEKVDEFCNHVDHKVTVYLLASREDEGMPRRCGEIISLALTEKIEEIDGSLLRMSNGEVWFRLYAGNGEEIVSKSPDRKVASLVLEMDFPHVSNTDDALREMFALAGKLARVLRFRLVDASQNTIDDAHIEEIQQEIMELREYMLHQGVRPGSKLARALFS